MALSSFVDGNERHMEYIRQMASYHEIDIIEACHAFDFVSTYLETGRNIDEQCEDAKAEPYYSGDDDIP
jgi:hypothetical protein